MAHNTESKSIPASVTASLEHLANRPGVVATLILSRKDGSVIRATGILSPPQPETDGQNTNGSSDSTKEAATTTEPTATETTEPARPEKPQPSALEVFAASVASFVSSATFMSESLQPSISGASSQNTAYSMLNGGSSDTQTTDADREDEQTGKEVSHVQLLRMRTKKHEVVIFPDSKFLSCVVQEVGKPMQNHDPTARP